MTKTTLTLSEPVAKTLKVYSVQSRSSLHAQSQVIEEALIEFFEKHNVKIEA
jgi:cobalamin biosynthesis protein CbiG